MDGLCHEYKGQIKKAGEKKKKEEERYLRTTFVPGTDKVQEEGIVDGVLSEQETEIDLLLFRQGLFGIWTGNARVLVGLCACLDRLRA